MSYSSDPQYEVELNRDHNVSLRNTMNTTENRISKRLCLFGKVSSRHFPKIVHPVVKINDAAMIPK